MTHLITEDDVDDLAFSALDDADPAVHLAIARQLEQWATKDNEYELEEDLPASYLLLTAVDHCIMAEDTEEGFRLAELLREHPSAAPFEAHPSLIRLHLADGHHDAAVTLSDEVRTGGVDSPLIAHEIATA